MINSNSVKLNAAALGQTRDLNANPRRLVLRKQLLVDRVHQREIVHVEQINGALRDLTNLHLDLLQQLLEVGHNLCHLLFE